MRVPISALNCLQLWLTIGVLVLAPLFFGSVDELWVAVWTVVLSVSVMAGFPLSMNARQIRIISAVLVLFFVYALVAVVQIAPHFLYQFDDPIWRRTNELLGLNSMPRISGQAELPPLAIGRFLLLLTSFMSGFFVGTCPRNANVLIWWARASILIYAIYGLLALVFTPDLLLWAPKVSYRGSLTASFVNHNTAATFIGAGVILWSCWAYSSLQLLDFSSMRLLLLTPSNERIVFKMLLRSVAALTCFFALLLTGSRGGLICTCFGLLIAIGLMATNRFKPGLWSAMVLGAFGLVVLVAWLKSAARIGTSGLLDEGRWSVYELCIKAIRERPLLGVGAGTFESFFPSLRPDDFNGWGVWDYAHSTILEIAVEMGIPIAIVVAAASVASLFLISGAALRCNKRRSLNLLASIAGIAFLTYLHSMIDFSLQIPGYLVVFGILVGCGLARSSAAEETTMMVSGSFIAKPVQDVLLQSTTPSPSNLPCD